MSILSLFGQTDAELYQYGTDSGYYTTSSEVSPETAAAVTAGMLGFVFVFSIIGYIISALCLSRIFKKAGVEQWKAWVPVYNTWTMLELGGQQGFWSVLMLIPVVNIVAAIFIIIAMYHIGLKLGKPGAFVLLAIFLPVVWLIWLAVDGSKWEDGKVATAPAAPTSTPQSPSAPVEPTTPPKDSDNQSTPPAAS